MVQKPASLHPCEKEAMETSKESTDARRVIFICIKNLNHYEYIIAQAIVKDAIVNKKSLKSFQALITRVWLQLHAKGLVFDGR